MVNLHVFSTSEKDRDSNIQSDIDSSNSSIYFIKPIIYGECPIVLVILIPMDQTQKSKGAK